MTGRVCLHCGGGIDERPVRARYCAGTCKKKAEYRRNPTAHKAIVDKNRLERKDQYNSQKAKYREANRDVGARATRKHYRTRAAAQHMQECLNALPAIMELINEMEIHNDQ